MSDVPRARLRERVTTALRRSPIVLADAPGYTRSMRIALEDLKLDRLLVVYPGVGGSYPLDGVTEVVGIEDLDSRLDAIFN